MKSSWPSNSLVVRLTGATAPGSSQLGFSWSKDWPVKRDRGVKMGTNGIKYRWVGYKLHWDVSDSP